MLKLSIFMCAVLVASVHTKPNDYYYVEGAENLEDNTTSLRFQSFYPENAFLAGELTPAWLAHEEHGNMIYKRLDADIVKQAIDYFESDQFRNVRRLQGMKRNVTLAGVPEILDFYKVAGEKQEKEEFRYPSVLVTMEFSTNWPRSKTDQDKLIYERILYALAYWNAVDIELRPIRYPSVRIRIAGIVIARDKDVIPFVKKHQSGMGIRIYESLDPMMMYWYETQRSTIDFREGSFNVVASMTDTKPLVGTYFGYSFSSTLCDSNYTVGGDTFNNLTGLLVYDDKAFSGIGQTVAEMAHIMGRHYTGILASVDAKSFTRSELNNIQDALSRSSSCWKQPCELYAPGRAVVTILPEDIFPH